MMIEQHDDRLRTAVSEFDQISLSTNVTLINSRVSLRKHNLPQLEIEEPQSRSKLRLFAILIALYVSLEFVPCKIP